LSGQWHPIFLERKKQDAQGYKGSVASGLICDDGLGTIYIFWQSHQFLGSIHLFAGGLDLLGVAEHGSFIDQNGGV
jgi:hypothetical protein